MSLNEDRGPLAMRPHRGMLLVIAADENVFAGLAAAGTLAPPYAIAGFAIVAAAALVSMRAREKNEQLIPPVAISERGDDLLRAVVAGLPDPVVALDRDGRVVVLNERARALAPALRQGEPVSFVLRMPELNEAITPAAGA